MKVICDRVSQCRITRCKHRVPHELDSTGWCNGTTYCYRVMPGEAMQVRCAPAGSKESQQLAEGVRIAVDLMVLEGFPYHKVRPMIKDLCKRLIKTKETK